MHIEFLSAALDQYCARHTSPESELLQKLNRETHLKVLKPRMLSGHVQGRFLAMISQMIRPKQILEIGTFTGYSALCLAEGLAPDGLLHTIDVNAELEDLVQEYIAAAGLENKIKYYLGKAADIIPGLDYQFDIVFIDADKRNNGRYYDLIFDKVSPGGFILIDNVVWSGKVVTESQNKKTDADTQAVLDFNLMIQQDDRVENLLLPLRDGIMLVRKK